MEARDWEENGYAFTKCPNCAYQFAMPLPAREPWSLSKKLSRQPGTLATVIASGFTAAFAQADTLPHPWNHVLTIVLLVVAILAAIKLKT